jgi:hypothetical protein
MFHDLFLAKVFKLCCLCEKQFKYTTINFGGGVGWGETVNAIDPTQIQNSCIFEQCFKSKEPLT